MTHGRPSQDRRDVSRRERMRTAMRRDLWRRERRTRGTAEFWRSVRVLGMVGWPIVLSAVGGAVLGRAIDRRLGTHLTWTVLLLLAGTALGSFVAWRAVKE